MVATVQRINDTANTLYQTKNSIIRLVKMSGHYLKTLLEHLPRHAEEEGDFYSVSRACLIAQIQAAHAIDVAIAETTVDWCESLLDTLAVLDSDYLSRGEWCFVSFPAQLLAISVLTAMSDPDSRYFPTRFWTTQGISNDKKNRQRDVLSTFENARVEYHARQAAVPIRYIYVAWGMIKCNDRILCYQREDTQKRFEKKAGDYGLIGGRANQNDFNSSDLLTALQVLQSPHSKSVALALTSTLERELLEEVGLQFDVHYTFKPWRKLKSYRQVQGAAPNHAFTEYYIDIYHIELTLDGYLFLQRKTNTHEQLIWFTIDDIVKGETIDGKILYLKALYEDFANDRSTLAAELANLPDSFINRYQFAPQKYGITIPIAVGQPILAGVLGKEKPCHPALTDRQLAIFSGLAAHLREFELIDTNKNIRLHPYGWVEVIDSPELLAELISLAALLKESDFCLENHCDRVFRLSISPEIIFFDETLFWFSVNTQDLKSLKAKIPVNIGRAAFPTALGIVNSKTEPFILTLEHVENLRQLSTKIFSADNEAAIKIEDSYKKGLHKESRFARLGLRNLVRREAGIIKFVARYECI